MRNIKNKKKLKTKQIRNKAIKDRIVRDIKTLFELKKKIVAKQQGLELLLVTAILNTKIMGIKIKHYQLKNTLNKFSNT